MKHLPESCESEAEPTYPGLFMSCCSVFFLGEQLVSFLLEVIYALTGWETSASYMLPRIYVIGLFCFTCYASQPVSGVARYFAFKAVPLRALRWVPASYLGILCVRTAIVAGAWQAAALMMNQEIGQGSSRDRDEIRWSLTLYSIILAPFTEEVLFRGVILQGLLQRYSNGVAIVTSALLFGFYHEELLRGVGAFVGGCCYGWLFVKTRSLWPPILLHACHNIATTVIHWWVSRTSAPKVNIAWPITPSTNPEWPTALLIFYSAMALMGIFGVGIAFLSTKAFLRDLVFTGGGVAADAPLPLAKFKSRRSPAAGSSQES